MSTATKTKARSRMILDADTAADLMTANPVSVRADAMLQEAIILLVDKGYSAAPVIDRAGRPVGVLSRSDIIVHDREAVEYLAPRREYYDEPCVQPRSGEPLKEGFQVERVDRTRVRDLMTPVIFSVPPDAPARRVITEMLTLKVHRMFVVDHDGVLIGVISALDVLRHLGD